MEDETQTEITLPQVEFGPATEVNDWDESGDEVGSSYALEQSIDEP